jgi:hypothetical protein
MQTITSGSYKTFSYTFNVGSRTITVYDLFDTSLTFNSLALLTLQRTGASVPIFAPSLSQVNTINYSIPPYCPSVNSSTGAGSVTLGNHVYAITNLIGSSETLPSSYSPVISASTGFQTILVTLPVGPPSTISRNLYRTNASTGIGSLYLVANIPDNSTLIFADTTADNQTTSSPTISNAYDINYNSSIGVLSSSDSLVIEVRNTDQSYDYNLNVQKTINQTPSELPMADPQVAPYGDTNLAPGIYYYECPASGWRNYTAQIKATCSSTSSILKVYATLDNTITATATNALPAVDWVDVTSNIFGVISIYVPISGTYVSPIYNWNVDPNGNQVVYDRFLVQYNVSTNVNFWQMNVRQF